MIDCFVLLSQREKIKDLGDVPPDEMGDEIDAVLVGPCKLQPHVFG